MSEDVLIIGGGPAGAALAVHLGRAGRKVLLVERTPGPHHKVCGEFLSGEALAELAALGLEVDALGAAPVGVVSLGCGKLTAAAPLPFPARSLSRLRLDEALLDLARRAGATVRRGLRATDLRREGERWLAAGAGWSAEAKNACLAVGKHDLKGWRRPPGGQDDLIGFKLHWRLAPDQAGALAGRVEIALFPGGYAGLEPIEGGLANLCAVIRRSRLADGWDGLLTTMRRASPQLDRRLRGAVARWPRALAVAGLPYGHVARKADGLWRLGDQAAVIPSFSGDGLAIALYSARLAAEAMAAGEDADRFQVRLARELQPQVRRALALSRLLVEPATQRLLAWTASMAPNLLVRAARATRIPSHALMEAPAPRRHDAAA